jgi:hypothetical protein
MIAAGQMGMYVRSSNHIFKGGTYADLSHGAVNNNGAATWNFTAGTSNDGSGFAKHFRGDAGTGTMTAATAVNARTGTSTGVAYIGTSNCSGTVANVECSHAYVAIFDRVLTQVQVDAAYQTLRPFMARRGITI